MHKWLNSMRVQILLVMILLATFGLVFTFFTARSIEKTTEVRQAQQGLVRTATQVLRLEEEGHGPQELSVISSVLSNQQIIVRKNSAIVYSSQPSRGTGGGELSKAVSDGIFTVSVIAHLPNTTAVSAELAATSGAVVLIVLTIAFWVSRKIAKSLSEPITQAINAAQRVARGDLAARIGDVGPEEFQSLARAFDSMAAKLEDHENEQKKFLGDLSHEIATPINAVSGFALAICDRTIKGQEELSEAAWLIQEETDRINHLLADLRTLDRLDIAHTVTKENFYLDVYIHELVLRFSAMSATKAVSLHWEAPHSIVYLDRRLLDMVVSNFISNAIRYVDPEGKVDLTVTQNEDNLVFRIRDNGIGISPEHLNRIFDRLYRIDEARDRVSGGSGLGLAIARRAAQSLGGRIEVESQRARGSEFRLLIPLTNASLPKSQS